MFNNIKSFPRYKKISSIERKNIKRGDGTLKASEKITGSIPERTDTINRL